MTKLTRKEFEALQAIDNSEYGDYLTDSVWTFTLEDNSTLSGKTISGTVSSLVKKGMVGVAKNYEAEEIWMTEKGVEAYRAMNGGSSKPVRED